MRGERSDSNLKIFSPPSKKHAEVFCLLPTGAESLNRNSFSFSDERLNSPTVFSPTALSPPLTSPKRESLRLIICCAALNESLVSY